MLAATIFTRCIFSCASRTGMAIPRSTGSRNADPADARSALGDHGSAVPRVVDRAGGAERLRRPQDRAHVSGVLHPRQHDHQRRIARETRRRRRRARAARPRVPTPAGERARPLLAAFPFRRRRRTACRWCCRMRSRADARFAFAGGAQDALRCRARPLRSPAALRLRARSEGLFDQLGPSTPIRFASGWARSPRSAARNSFSHLLSRLVITLGSALQRMTRGLRSGAEAQCSDSLSHAASANKPTPPA